ncbi:MAG TPA: hypothetical protein VK778_11255 [Solirubrobacteraceae bacterium]|nr:hypothetical protein [Solirubrobacteraceae bacterium]
MQQVVTSPEVEFALTATRSDFTEVKRLGPFATEPYAKELGVQEATAANVRAALEGEEVYGRGDVQVTGTGAGGQAPPFTVTIADRAVPALSVEALKGTASVSVLSEGRADGYVAVTAVNVGDGGANAEASPVRVSDVLPEHVKARFIEGSTVNHGGEGRGPVHCEVGTLTCSFSEGCKGLPECEVARRALLEPFEEIEVLIGVELEAGAVSGELNEASVSGGGAPTAVIRHPLTVAGAPGEATPFGVEGFELTPEEVGGAVDAQAGSHPFQFTTTFDISESITRGAGADAGREEPVPSVLPKDVDVELPPGLVGNPTAYPRCTLAQFFAKLCAADTVLGVATVKVHELIGMVTDAIPIFNLEPSEGEAARFGFAPAEVPVLLGATVRTGSDYGVTVHAESVPETVGFLASTLTFWGVPGDSLHDPAREAAPTSGGAYSQSEPEPFLSLPTSCAGELRSSLEMDAWEQPGVFVHASSSEPAFASEGLPALDGCSLVPFAAEVRVSPDGTAASSPSGVSADVHVPQAEASNEEGLAPADVKNITVTLPEGVAPNASIAGGLEVCTLTQIGYLGENAQTHVREFTDEEPSCPDASKLASVTIKTPLLPAGQYVRGFVYLAAPQNFAGIPENPFSSLLAAYIVAKDPISGVLVKLPAKVTLNQATGQITTSVEDNPQLPFEDAEFEFFAGERSALATPARCGLYTTEALFEPWTNTEQSHEELRSSSEFDISSGPELQTASGLLKTPCPGASLPFAPTLSAQATNIGAGAFSPLSTTLSREDGQQSLQSATLRYPSGATGVLKGVPLCAEAQANTGSCPAESMIGEATAAVGVGADPFTVTGGKVYLTEKYAGAPFGLSIVTPAKAGPFDLQEGRPVVVRAKLEIDRRSGVLTVTTGAIPTIIEGVPLQIQHVNVTATRPGFTLNPASCSQATITGTVDGAEAASAPVSAPFQLTNCASLSFTPTLAVSTAGHASKADGAALLFKISYPKNALGAQAWFHETMFDFPKQLPARLETLQKACRSATFEADPAACPAGSIIGHATVHTQLLPVPLAGPVYFVSYGNAKFPETVMVLQGYGITVEIHGETFVNEKTGVTSATFKSLPELPFETIEVTIPAGPYSEFAANVPLQDRYDLCGQNLKMPTLLVASDGAEIHQNTQIAITGCKKALTRKQKLAAALKACHRKKGARRAKCDAKARHKYATKAKTSHIAGTPSSPAPQQASPGAPRWETLLANA